MPIGSRSPPTGVVCLLDFMPTPGALYGKPGRSHARFPAESAVLWEALGTELYEAVLAVRPAEAELFAMFTDADGIEAVRRRY